MLSNCNEAVRRDGGIELYADGILVSSPKGFDSQMLLNPLKEQLHLPSVFVKQCYMFCRYLKVVGQEDKHMFLLLIVIADSPQYSRVLGSGFVFCKANALVKNDVVFTFQDLVHVNNLN